MCPRVRQKFHNGWQEHKGAMAGFFNPIEREIRRRGGRFKSSGFDALFTPLETTLGLAAESAGFFLRAPRSVTSAFVDSQPFNASATIVSRHQYLLTVNAGMVFTLLIFFSRLVNQPDFLPSIVDGPLPGTPSDDLKKLVAYRKSKAVEAFRLFSLIDANAARSTRIGPDTD
jgi:hypothetical protein